MRHIDDIAAKVRRAERIDDAEAARLWREAPLWLLGELATVCCNACCDLIPDCSPTTHIFMKICCANGSA